MQILIPVVETISDRTKVNLKYILTFLVSSNGTF